MELFKITEDHQSLREAGALDHALGYVRERWQFGKRIADFQGIQFMLADMVMPLEAARQLVYAAAAIDLMGGAAVRTRSPADAMGAIRDPCW